MLESLSAVDLRADSIIREWYIWKDNAAVGFTDTTGGRKILNELRNMKTNAVDIGNRAREVQAMAGFDTIDPKKQSDVIKIAEEMEILAVEIDEVAHPDKAWAKLDDHKKGVVTERVEADDAVVSALRNRAQGLRRGQGTPPPKKNPPPGK